MKTSLLNYYWYKKFQLATPIKPDKTANTYNITKTTELKTDQSIYQNIF